MQPLLVHWEQLVGAPGLVLESAACKPLTVPLLYLVVCLTTLTWDTSWLAGFSDFVALETPSGLNTGSALLEADRSPKSVAAPVDGLGEVRQAIPGNQRKSAASSLVHGKGTATRNAIRQCGCNARYGISMIFSGGSLVAKCRHFEKDVRLRVRL